MVTSSPVTHPARGVVSGAVIPGFDRADATGLKADELIVNLCPTGMVPRGRHAPRSSDPAGSGRRFRRCANSGASIVHIHPRRRRGVVRPRIPRLRPGFIARSRSAPRKSIFASRPSGRVFQPRLEGRVKVVELTATTKAGDGQPDPRVAQLPETASINAPEDHSGVGPADGGMRGRCQSGRCCRLWHARLRQLSARAWAAGRGRPYREPAHSASLGFASTCVPAQPGRSWLRGCRRGPLGGQRNRPISVRHDRLAVAMGGGVEGRP